MEPVSPMPGGGWRGVRGARPRRGPASRVRVRVRVRGRVRVRAVRIKVSAVRIRVSAVRVRVSAVVSDLLADARAAHGQPLLARQ